MSGEAKRTMVGALIVLVTLGYLVVGGIGDNLVYFVTPTELLARESSAIGQPLRLSGAVASGSVVWNAESLSLTFRIADGERSVPVKSEGAPPHMFQDGIQVIVEGHLERTGVFQANNLMVKHSNEYGPGDTPAGPAHTEETSGS